MAEKFIYLFKQGAAEGSSSMSNLLGGKGANLAEMSNLNIPVPPGFTISTEVCTYFMKHNKYPAGLKSQVNNAMKHIELQMGKNFGARKDPLLVSVRSGGKISMPGMMETVLNVGLNDCTIQGLLAKTKNDRFTFDSYRRLIMMYADVVMDKSNGLDSNIRTELEHIMTSLKKDKAVISDYNLSGDDFKALCLIFKKHIKEKLNLNFPEDPYEQLWGSIDAVFKSWNGTRAREYRKIEGISETMGTGVNIQAMVFGNMGSNSATGVAFTKNPSTGENIFFGEWLPNAQGEDVVAGIRTPYPIDNSNKKKNLKNIMPDIYKELDEIQKILENHYLDMQDLEFTIQENKLWILQTRNGKRNGPAAIKIALNFLANKKISEKIFLNRIKYNHITELLYPTLSEQDKKIIPIAQGLPAGPGSAYGQIVFDSEKAKILYEQGHKVILVREETSPEDVHGMFASSGILTARGGMTSHAALVARGWGKCCIVGCRELEINYQSKTCSINNIIYKELDWLTLNGTTGNIYNKKLSLIAPNLNENEEFQSLMQICAKNKRIEIRANADSKNDANLAKSMNAKGIGLCRTEHMFFEPSRIHEVRKMILAADINLKQSSINKLLSFQKKDFYEIFKAMAPHRVTIRLLDPPLHEFLPDKEDQIKIIAEEFNINISDVKSQISNLTESNPMLGHRGCRLGITSPEITKMQSMAILESAYKLKNENIECLPEIMIPLVGSVEEFINQRNIVDSVAKILNQKYNTIIDYSIGAMIELPRACIIADQIAQHADFISFGTNDLTQTSFGFSRDDISTFLPQYIEKSILDYDPFVTLDVNGVGELIKIALTKARSVNPNIKIGICGEHGGDPKSISFFNKMDFDYISCSPFRLPVAYLAAAKTNNI